MAIPVAYFTFTSNGLILKFQDKSTNIPTSWSWDFGFSTGVSTVQNPTVTFPSENVYKVRLTATNVSGSGIFDFDIRVSNTPIIGLTIYELIMAELPSGLTVNENFFNGLIKKWQLYFQSAAGITNADVFNEAKWPELYNILVARLVIYDLVLLASRNIITSTTTRTLLTGGVISNGKGPVKKIETGPSNVEWYDPSSQWANILKAGGLLDNTRDEICMLALQLGVRLYFCPIPKSTRVFIVGKKPKKLC